MPAMLAGLSVLTPAAWWALSALAIPLLIHLFSRSRGRLVRIGHIDLIRQARRVKVTELRLTQWLLLMLRLGIFTLAALILAGLVTTDHETSAEPEVYLTREWVQSASAEDRNAVFEDAGTVPSTRLFLLQPGFPEVDRAKLETLTRPSTQDSAGNGDTWTLLAERLSQARHDGPVTVYATDFLMQYGRDKPALPGEISWRTSHAPAAAAPEPVSIHVLVSYDRDRAGDARLIETALAALRAERLPGLLWESIERGQPGAASEGVDWLIRLGNGVTDSAGIDPAGAPLVIFSDATDAGKDVSEQSLDLPFYPFSQFRLNRLSLDSATAQDRADPSAWRTLVSTNELDPVLQESRLGRVRLLQFNSRFDPGWSSLAQQAEFPELLLQLMLEPGEEVRRFAGARIDPAGLAAAAPANGAETPLPYRSLQPILVLLLVVLWITERWLSERRSREGL